MVEQSNVSGDAHIFTPMTDNAPFFGNLQLMVSRSRLDKIPMDVVTLILSNCTLLDVMKTVP